MTNNNTVAVFTHKKTIIIRWSFEDVQSLRGDLTDEQAMHVLDAVEDNHDANIGVNWAVLEEQAEWLYPS